MYTSKNDTLCFSITNRSESDFGDICETNKRFIDEQKFQNTKSSINDVFIMNEEEILRNIKKLNGFVVVPCNNNVASYILSLCEKQALQHSPPPTPIQKEQEDKESIIRNNGEAFQYFNFNVDLMENEEINLTTTTSAAAAADNVKYMEINNNNLILENEMNLLENDNYYDDHGDVMMMMFGKDVDEEVSKMDVSENNIDWLLSNNLKVNNDVNDDIMKLLDEINIDSMALELDFSFDSFDLDYNLKLFDTLNGYSSINANDYDAFDSTYNLNVDDKLPTTNESSQKDISKMEKKVKAKRKPTKNLLDKKSKTISKSKDKFNLKNTNVCSSVNNILSDHSYYCESKMHKEKLNLKYAFNVTFANMTENLKRRNLHIMKHRNRYADILNNLSDGGYDENDILTCWETLYDSDSSSGNEDNETTYNVKDDYTEIKNLFAARHSDSLSKSILLLKSFLPYCGKDKKYTSVKSFINSEMINNYTINRRMVSCDGFWSDLKRALTDTRSFLLIDEKYVVPLRNVDSSIYRNHKFQFETVRLFDRLIDFNSNVMYGKRSRKIPSDSSFITIHLRKVSINSLPEVLICPSRDEITIFSFIHVRRITISKKNIIKILPLTTLIRIITKHWLSNYHNSALKITLHGRLVY